MTDINMTSLAAQINELDAQIEQLKEHRDQLAEALLSAIPEGTKKMEAGDYTISVRAGARRLNTRKIETEYPQDQYPQLYTQKTVLATDEVKRQMSAAFLTDNDLYTVGKPSVSVK